MSDVQYDNQGNAWDTHTYEPTRKRFTERLVEWGVASSEDQAQYILIGVGILSLCVMVYFIGHGVFHTVAKPPGETSEWPVTAPPAQH